MVLFVQLNLSYAVARRKNDPFAPRDADTKFAAEVKRVAAARDLTLRELARRVDLDHTVVLRQIRDAKKTQEKTAKRYATALEVPELYLRLLAGCGGAWTSNSTDIESAITALRAIATDAWIHIQPEKRDVFWAEIIAALGRDDLHSRKSLENALVFHTRSQVNATFGVDEKRSAILELTEILKPLGLDTRIYAAGASNSILADVYLMMSGTVSDDDVRAHVDLQRELLESRGEYTPKMDDHLGRMQSDPRYVVELRGSEKAKAK